MNLTKWLLMVAVCMATIGCGDGNPGGTGATRDKKPMVGTAEDTFTLDAPNLTTGIKQGETKQISIDIKRGKNFGEDVALSFEGMPKGVTLDPAAPTIKKGDTGTKINVKAADDAALGKFTVKVKGTPAKGPAATNEFSISVDKK